MTFIIVSYFFLGLVSALCGSITFEGQKKKRKTVIKWMILCFLFYPLFFIKFVFKQRKAILKEIKDLINFIKDWLNDEFMPKNYY